MAIVLRREIITQAGLVVPARSGLEVTFTIANVGLEDAVILIKPSGVRLKMDWPTIIAPDTILVEFENRTLQDIPLPDTFRFLIVDVT